MRIYKSVFDKIINIPVNIPSEVGGIVGGNGGIVTDYCYDTGVASDIACSYTPNVSLLNSIISEWSTNGIQFMGIYHTHFFGVQTLSDGDIRYIDKILLSMPERIDSLYFPVVVLPQRTMVCFKTIKKFDSIEIYNDKLILI